MICKCGDVSKSESRARAAMNLKKLAEARLAISALRSKKTGHMAPFWGITNAGSLDSGFLHNIRRENVRYEKSFIGD